MMEHHSGSLGRACAHAVMPLESLHACRSHMRSRDNPLWCHMVVLTSSDGQHCISSLATCLTHCSVIVKRTGR